ncbi:MAG TPA: YCF48-related protein [Candidatus Paceibacterota bacterium]
MKPLSLIIVMSLIIGAILVFSPVSLRNIIASFPLFKGLGTASEKPAATQLSAQQAIIWRTIDGGATWFPQTAVEADANLPEVSVLDIVFDKENSNIIYAGTEGAGLYRSFNNGQNWEKLIDRNGVLADNALVYKIVQDGKNVNNIYLAVFQDKRGMFLKSTDGGISFTRTYLTQLENYPVEAIAVNPSASNIIYMGTKQGGFFVSRDYGETWNAAKWITGQIIDIVVNPRNTDEIYAATRDRGLFRSSDGGETWHDFNKELARVSARHAISSFILESVNGDALYLAIANGLVKSNNRGRIWEFVNILIPSKALPVDAIAIDPGNPDMINVGVDTLLYKSEDGGVNWSVQKLDTAKRIAIMTIDEKDPKSILLGMKVVNRGRTSAR